MKNTKKRGFTIVELVIVIAVIAILASVLIPTFTNVVNAAKESKNLQAARNAYTDSLAIVLADGDITENEYAIVDGWTVTFTTAGKTNATVTKDAVTYEMKDGVFAKKTAPAAGGGN